MSLPFRALLIDPDSAGDRPKQIFGSSRDEINRWASLILTKTASPRATVEIYQTTESRIATVAQPRDPEAAALALREKGSKP